MQNFSVQGSEIKLQGNVDFSSTPQLIKDLKSTIFTGKITTIDWSAVIESNTAALAMIVELIRDAKKSGNVIKNINLPDRLMRIAALSNLQIV